MVGRVEHRALIVALLLAGAEANAAEVFVELGAASPFTDLRARVRLFEDLELGAAIALVDGRALRPGVAAGWRWWGTDDLGLGTELVLARSFSALFDNGIADTWEAELKMALDATLDPEVRLELELGALGAEARQRGVVGVATLRVWRTIGDGLELGFELGWMLSAAAHRPHGGLRLRWRLPVPPHAQM